MGVAIGVFFGVLIPVAQIPLSATVAVVVRANVPAAVASTLVTNPATFGPLYFVAYRVGERVLGTRDAGVTEASLEARSTGWTQWTSFLWERLHALGRPLLIGLAIMAVLLSVASYVAIELLWRVSTILAWRRRARERRPRD